MARWLKDIVLRRRVYVNRDLKPIEVVGTTAGRKQHIQQNVLIGMPRGKGRIVEVCFFEYPGGKIWVENDELERKYVELGLVPDPLALAVLNENDLGFADSYNNATHWKDAEGGWCFIAYELHRYHDLYCRPQRDRSVYVMGEDKGWWANDWLFGGVRA